MSVPRAVSKFNGVFAVIKPSGITSAKLVDKIYIDLMKGLKLPVTNPSQKLFKMGHGGTLDLEATGVLVVGVGKGCSNLPAFLHGDKKYVSTAVLGTETDTHNATGNVTAGSPYDHITKEMLCERLKDFVGDIQQVPPVYSALKVRGQRRSDLAREGHEVAAPEARPVKVHKLTCTHFRPPTFSLSIHCGGGFYVRKLIHDLGIALGSHAHMLTLERTQHGPYTQSTAIPEDAWTPEVVLDAIKLNRKLIKPFLDESHQKFRAQMSQGIIHGESFKRSS